MAKLSQTASQDESTIAKRILTGYDFISNSHSCYQFSPHTLPALPQQAKYSKYPWLRSLVFRGTWILVVGRLDRLENLVHSLVAVRSIHSREF
jgi:hypothetical protein